MTLGGFILGLGLVIVIANSHGAQTVIAMVGLTAGFGYVVKTLVCGISDRVKKDQLGILRHKVKQNPRAEERERYEEEIAALQQSKTNPPDEGAVKLLQACGALAVLLSPVTVVVALAGLASAGLSLFRK